MLNVTAQVPPQYQILIADDDEDARRIIEVKLKRNGYQVVTAKDGREALDLYQKTRPDLVMLDCLMPEMDGYETCQRLRSLPGGDNIPILMITALQDDASIAQAFESGVNDYISKPIQWAVLRHRMRRLIESSQAQAQLTAAQARMKAIVRHALDSIITCNSVGDIESCNPAAELMFGYTAAEFGGRSVYDFIEEVENQIAEPDATWANGAEEGLGRRKNGTTFPIEYSTSQFVVGSEQYFTFILRDISRRKEVEQALAEAKQQIQKERDFARQVLNNMGQGLTVLNEQGEFEYINPAYARMAGYTPEELLGKTPFDVTPAADHSILNEASVARHNGKDSSSELRMQKADGEELYVLVSSVPRWQEAKLDGAISVITDLTERRQAEEKLRESEERYRTLISALEEGVILHDETGRILTCNASAERILGFNAAQLTGRASIEPRWQTVHPDGTDFPGEEHPIAVSLKTGLSQHNVIMGLPKPDGSNRWISVNSRPLFHSGETKPYAAVASFFDITEARRLEEELTHQAFYDNLTGLPNRVLFHDRLEHILAQARRHSDNFTIGFIDLDGFKQVNDTEGHAVGDQLLKQVATRLKGCLRAEDTVARLGGDEFTLILPGIGSPDTALRVGKMITTELARPFEIEHRCIKVTASVGMSLYPLHGQDLEILTKKADSAMYNAKEAGKNLCLLFTED